MSALSQNNLKKAARELDSALRNDVARAIDRYEQQSGQVVTRIEIYRMGVDWSIEVFAVNQAEVPVSKREMLFVGSHDGAPIRINI